MLPVAVLAGGLATRVRPLTETIPKALIEVAGQPFIFRQLDYLAQQGVRRVVLCVGYRGDQIQTHVGDGAKFGLEVRYSYDGPKLLGTGGALCRAVSLLGEQFFVLYGDSFVPVEFEPVQRAFESAGQPALMTVLRNSGLWDVSNVLFKEGLLIEYNKHSPRPEMHHVDYGLGIISKHVLTAYRPGAAFDLADVYHDLSLKRQLAGHEVQQRFYEIGSQTGLRETEEYFQTKGKA